DAIRTVFHPDAHDDHGTYKGGVDGLIEWIKNRHSGITFSMHSVSNCLIEFVDENKAIVESYCIALQKYPPEASVKLTELVGTIEIPSDSPIDMTIARRYVDTITRLNDVWGIQERVVILDSVSVAPGIAIDNIAKIGWTCGKRGNQKDPIYSILHSHS